MMQYTFLARTDPGRARDNNEDAVLVDESAQLGVLADGMGGYNAGEIASGMATAFIKSEMAPLVGRNRQQRQAQGDPTGAGDLRGQREPLDFQRVQI